MKINRNTNENNLYMKIDQKNMTNPNMPSIRLSQAASIANLEPSPSGSSVRKCRLWENIPGCYPPSPISCSAVLEHP